MDVESELNLYDHVEFLNHPTSNSRSESQQNATGVTNKTSGPSKKKQNKNNRKKNRAKVSQTIPKPAQSKKLPQLTHKLNAYELLFFPKHHDATPLYSRSDPKDLLRKKNYIEKISKMTPKEQRAYRSNRDARYLHKKANTSNTTSTDETGDREFCLSHLNDRCADRSKCNRWHQMRNTRFFGVCKYYISGVCTNGDQCRFMHEDFPCRYYYLNIKHPKSMDANNCRFMHGGPLPQRLYKCFMKQIEMHVKDITKEKPEQYDDTLSELVDKFESKQAELEREAAGTINESFTSLSSNDDRFTIDSILTGKQMKALTDKNIKTVAQINQLEIDDLLELGLSMDQIYKITTNTCMETSAQATDDSLKEDSLKEDSLKEDLLMEDEHSCQTLGDLSTLVRFEKSETDFHGFSEANRREAEEILRVKKRLFEVDYQIGECVTTQFDSMSEAITTDAPSQIQLAHFKPISSDKKVPTNQQQNNEDSDDSDSENCLIINEEALT